VLGFGPGGSRGLRKSSRRVSEKSGKNVADGRGVKFLDWSRRGIYGGGKTSTNPRSWAVPEYGRKNPQRGLRKAI